MSGAPLRCFSSSKFFCFKGRKVGPPWCKRKFLRAGNKCSLGCRTLVDESAVFVDESDLDHATCLHSRIMLWGFEQLFWQT